MASQRDIRRRIGAVKNIKQITRAMQFVAASKLKRAQDATLASRPYSEKLDEVLADLAAVLGADDHPLLAAQAEGGKRLLILITTDRGLAGPLNTNTIRFVSREITEDTRDLTVVTVGRKGRDAMRRAGVPMEAHFAGFGDRPSFADVIPLARLISDDYLAGKYAVVDIIYSRFVSTLTQRPESFRLLPIEPASDADAGIPGNQFIFEPNAATVLEQLLPRYVATRLFQAVLESKASEEIEPDGRDEERDRERRGTHRGPDPLVQQGPPVQHHARDDRDRVGRQRPLTGGIPPMATAAPTATGRVIQITGPVVDIEFPAGELPAILNAVEIQREGQDSLVCEVQQHLGNNWVRSVAMTTTDGLARGVPVLDTGAPITVPVGEATLGRVFNVLGRPIDDKGPVEATTHLPIHRRLPPSTSSRPRSRSSRPASRSSTCSARSRRAARSACSAAPASARRSSSRS